MTRILLSALQSSGSPRYARDDSKNARHFEGAKRLWEPCLGGFSYAQYDTNIRSAAIHPSGRFFGFASE